MLNHTFIYLQLCYKYFYLLIYTTYRDSIVIVKIFDIEFSAEISILRPSKPQKKGFTNISVRMYVVEGPKASPKDTGPI